LMQPAISEI